MDGETFLYIYSLKSGDIITIILPDDYQEVTVSFEINGTKDNLILLTEITSKRKCSILSSFLMEMMEEERCTFQYLGARKQNMYPHICEYCQSPSWNGGMNNVDCSNPNCPTKG